MRYFKCKGCKKARRLRRALTSKQCRKVSDWLQIAGSLLATLGDDFKADLLAFVQRAHSCTLDRGDVHEDVLRAIVRLNEAEAFLGIEKFHSSDRHQVFLSRFLLNAQAIIAWTVTSQVFGSSLEAHP